MASRASFSKLTPSPLAATGITRSAGSSLKLCLVASGDADLYPRFGRTMEWDIAAGHAIVAAAGGGVADLEGEPLSYGMACSRRLPDEPRDQP